MVPMVLALVMFIFIHEKKDGHVLEKRESFWHNIKQLDNQLKLYLAVAFVFTLGNSSNTFLLLRAKSIGFNDTMVILLMAATFHDADHPGRTNKIPFELEERSMNFFKNWWKNNSLFVENIMNLTPIQVEQSVVELILFTDFIKGKDTQLEKAVEEMLKTIK